MKRRRNADTCRACDRPRGEHMRFRMRYSAPQDFSLFRGLYPFIEVQGGPCQFQEPAPGKEDRKG